MDVFPRTAIVPHAGLGRVLCWCPPNVFFLEAATAFGVSLNIAAAS